LDLHVEIFWSLNGAGVLGIGEEALRAS